MYQTRIQFTKEDGSDLGEMLGQAFQVMNVPNKERSEELTKEINQFPYVNGGLFASDISIPKMGYKARKIIIESGEYSQFLSAIKLIQQDSPKSEILVRINVSNRTLDSLTNIANELAEIKQNNNLKIMVSKVWQVNAEKLDEKKILDFVLQCQTNKIQCSYLATSKYTYGCYADNYNQVVINYDGNIYKCTARTFSSENSYGLITSEGQLEWNEMKLQDRLNLELPYRCQICNFLPACPKPCSQKLLEKGENLPCILNKKYGKENYIIEDFYNFLIESNNEK